MVRSLFPESPAPPATLSDSRDDVAARGEQCGDRCRFDLALLFREQSVTHDQVNFVSGAVGVFNVFIAIEGLNRCMTCKN